MSRILFVLPSLPYPLLTGADQAMYNGIFSIKDDYEVFIVFPVSTLNKKKLELRIRNSSLNGVHVCPFVYNPFKNVYSLFLRKVNSIYRKFKKKDFDCFCSDMLSDLSFQLPDYVSYIHEFVGKYKIDIVQMEMYSCLPYVLALPDSVKKIFVHHELRYVVNEQRIQDVGCTPYRRACSDEAKILEIGMLNKCDAIITLSEADKMKLLQAGVLPPVFSSTAIVKTKSHCFESCSVGKVLSFVGPAAHIPNYIGLMWFLENCWNELQKKDPSYVLNIIGNWPVDKRKNILKKYKNVHFLGFVSNLAESLKNTIMIVPITIGSGIRMKILEAASLGIPFVSTSIGSEGLPFESGKDYFRADTPETFINSIVELENKSLRENFVRRAYAIVREKYSAESLRKKRLEIYEMFLKRG